MTNTALTGARYDIDGGQQFVQWKWLTMGVLRLRRIARAVLNGKIDLIDRLLRQAVSFFYSGARNRLVVKRRSTFIHLSGFPAT
jgi:hypothetical protein